MEELEANVFFSFCDQDKNNVSLPVARQKMFILTQSTLNRVGVVFPAEDPDGESRGESGVGQATQTDTELADRHYSSAGQGMLCTLLQRQSNFYPILKSMF